jgi:tetratricopeptide (TPR) repeat protein
MPSHIYSMLGMWKESVAANQAALRVAAEFAEKHGIDGVLADVPRAYDALAYAHLQLGQDASALAAVNEAAKPAKVVGSLPVAQAARAAVAARYALERQDWKAAAKLEMVEGTAVAETATRFARALGAARSGEAGLARAEINKLRAVRAAFDGAHQVYWTEQTEMLILAAQAWVVQAQGNRREAHKLMRAAADLEDASAKNAVLESRLYPMRELLADLLREQGDPGAALTEYEVVLKATPNRLRTYYGAAKSAEAIGEKKKATAYFQLLGKLTQDADSERAELAELKAKTP